MPENGNMPGPTEQGIQALIAKDKDAEFDVDADSVIHSSYRPWKSSPRVVKIPLFDPTREVHPGKKPIVFNNFTDFWIEGMHLSAAGAREQAALYADFLIQSKLIP